VPPNCYPAYAFAKRALQATTMASIDAAARLDRDWLSRGMSDPASLGAYALRYGKLREGDHRALPGLRTLVMVWFWNVGSAAREKSPLLPQLQT
jgi:hypothetical protein